MIIDEMELRRVVLKAGVVLFAKALILEEDVLLKMHAKNAGRRATQPNTVQLPNQFHVLQNRRGWEWVTRSE